MNNNSIKLENLINTYDKRIVSNYLFKFNLGNTEVKLNYNNN